MVAAKQLDVVVLAIMIAITAVNLGLALNFAAIISQQALVATISTETIFLIAAIELAAVLLAYVFYKQRAFPSHA